MKMKLQESVKVLTKALKKDAGLYEGYKSNIAMAFVDRCAQYKKENNKSVLSKTDIHTIANEAADNFLKLLCK